ncbi:MAG: PHP domain-containing protein [Nitrospinota bacterium]|nr:MAG: PHP domain-containing protein [Nitrospinota bacterium]
MIIDMHVHSEVSLDSTAKVEEYCQAIQRFRQYHPFHGFVLTEHRVLHRSEEYQRLAEQYDVLILQGVEVDANLGHLLLYGVTDEFLAHVDISHRCLDDREVIRIIRDCGGIAIPAHPFRESVYGKALEQKLEVVEEVTVIEALNGANSPLQNEKAQALLTQHGLKGTGGSDAHYVNRHWFLNCATEFFQPITSMEDLVSALYQGNFRPLVLDTPPWEEL